MVICDIYNTCCVPGKFGEISPAVLMCIHIMCHLIAKPLGCCILRYHLSTYIIVKIENLRKKNTKKLSKIFVMIFRSFQLFFDDSIFYHNKHSTTHHHILFSYRIILQHISDFEHIYDKFYTNYTTYISFCK